MRERALNLLRARRGIWVLAGVAALLTVPALGAGFATDDHNLAFSVRHEGRWFTLFQLRPDELAPLRHQGAFAWWSNPQLAFGFLRPLASLTHAIEFRLWPDSPWAMHLTSTLLYALAAVIAALAYRELLADQPRLAAFAALLFTIDDAHAGTVGWLSARNTLLAGLFSLAALLLHARARSRHVPAAGRSPSSALHAASALSFGMALFSAEAGLTGFGLLLAYALSFEPGSWLRRLRSLSPQLIVLAVWALVYFAGHYGTRGTSFYRELGQPLFVLQEGVLDLPIWLWSLFGTSPVSFAIAFPADPLRLVMLVLVLPLLVAIVRALPRTRLNAFFGLVTLFCLPPLFTTLPQERLLIPASFGALALVASCISSAGPVLRRLLIAVHVVLAPLGFVATLNTTRPIENGARALLNALPDRPRHVVALNLPTEMISANAWGIVHSELGHGVPDSLHQLYAGSSALELTRLDANTLELHALEGWGRIPFERILCALEALPRAGSERSFESMRVSVRESNPEGRPTRVQFHFPTPLESPERTWLVWQGKAPVPWQPPAVGQRVRIAPLAPFSSLPL